MAIKPPNLAQIIVDRMEQIAQREGGAMPSRFLEGDLNRALEELGIAALDLEALQRSLR